MVAAERDPIGQRVEDVYPAATDSGGPQPVVEIEGLAEVVGVRATIARLKKAGDPCEKLRSHTGADRL